LDEFTVDVDLDGADEVMFARCAVVILANRLDALPR